MCWKDMIHEFMRCSFALNSTNTILKRSSCLSELPLKVVQARMGHSSVQITADRYGHLFPRGDDSAAAVCCSRVRCRSSRSRCRSRILLSVASNSASASASIASLASLRLPSRIERYRQQRPDSAALASRWNEEGLKGRRENPAHYRLRAIFLFMPRSTPPPVSDRCTLPSMTCCWQWCICGRAVPRAHCLAKPHH